MGPVTGFRVINLRIPGTVAYADLVVDLGSGGHVVIGLENGGGKSTLLGFLIHVLLPHKSQFLPRLAQRRQHKEGEEKKVQQYVPGGDPTHIVLEVEVPHDDPFRGHRRVLLGACLSKAAGARPDDPIAELLWSAISVHHDLTLSNLAVRGELGGLRDAKQWKAWLKQQKADHPDAEITVEEDQDDWARHLRNNLRIDVDFVRTWLLAMNQDEGAADHVFTYASSRAFLNSLVTAVADTDVREELATSLTRMGMDADAISMDRARQVLLSDVVAHTEQLSTLMRDLDVADEHRLTSLDGFLAAQQAVNDLTRTGSIELETAKDRHDAAVTAHQQADSGKQRAAVRKLLAQLQRDRVDLAVANRRLQAERDRKAEAERAVQVARVAAIVARRTSVHGKQISLQRMLAELEARSEPMRREAAAAVTAWQRQIAADLAETQQKAAANESSYHQAEQQAREAGQAVAAAHQTIGVAESRKHAVAEQLRRISDQRAAAIGLGDLLADQEPSDVLAAVADERAELERFATQVGDALDELIQQSSEAEGAVRTNTSRVSEARSQAGKAADTLRQLTEQTTTLAGEIASSGLLDLDPIRLDDHADTIVRVLKGVADRAHGGNLRAFERSIGAQRAVHSLEHRGLLPARPDVEDFCTKMLAQGWGTRPGWDYLATLESVVAQQCAAAHPALADGILVTDPDDTGPVLAWLQAHRHALTSPIMVGAPDAFHLNADEAGGDQVVVLPHDAFWSAAAGQQQLADTTDEHTRHEQDMREHQRVYDQAVRLGDVVARWRTSIGADGLRTAEQSVSDADEFAEDCDQDLATAEERLGVLRRQQQALVAQAGQISRQQLTAQARHGRLDALTRATAEQAELTEDAAQITDTLAQARRTHETATKAVESARTTQAKLRTERSALDKLEGRLRHEHAEAAALADTVVHPTDRFEQSLTRSDRSSLAAQTRAATDRWKGALSDGQIAAQISQNADLLREFADKLGAEDQSIVTAAETHVQENPTRSSADFEAETERGRDLADRISADVGRCESASETSSRRHDDTTKRYENQPMRDQLTGDDHSDDAGQAAIIFDRLTREAGAAAETATAAGRAERDTARAVGRVDGRQQLFANAAATLDGKISLLATGQQLTDSIDLEDRRFSLNTSAALAQAPTAIGALLETLRTATDSDQSRTAVNDRLATLSSLVDTIGKRVRDANGRAGQRLSRLAQCLDLATDDLVSHERVIQILRRERGAALARKAVQHHGDLVGRRDSVTHHVAKFDERVQKLADITYGRIERLRRAVLATVRDSVLPDTPAMGRWAGLHLLKLTGLDTLTVEDRKAAILGTLHRWFDPDLRGQRRRFDTDETVFDLLAAVTPRFTAKILIPSDPLIAEHQPVEQVAKRTSGGEGVTVALILAALLAARRATAHGYRRTTLLLDNPFAKLTKPVFWQLALDVATSLNVSLIALTGIKDTAALTVFPTFVKLRVSRRSNANFVVPYGITNDRLQDLVRDGALYVSATEWALAEQEDDGSAWPVISSARVAFDQQLTLTLPTAVESNHGIAEAANA